MSIQEWHLSIQDKKKKKSGYGYLPLEAMEKTDFVELVEPVLSI